MSDSQQKHARASVTPFGSVEDVAADWLARREAGLSAEDEREFNRWLDRDERHRAELARLQRSWTRLQQPRRTHQAEVLATLIQRKVKRRRRTRRMAGLAIAASVALLLVVAAGRFFPDAEPRVALEPAVATIVIKPERRLLPDGSVIELNAGAEVEVTYLPDRRDVRLVKGQAHFDVAKDPQRPFVVTAGPVAVRAVGTAFAVEFGSEEIGVLVTEGRVQVDRLLNGGAQSSAEFEPEYVDAGRWLAVPIEPMLESRPVIEVSADRMQTELAWRGMRVEFSDTPLGEAIALFNANNRLQLAVVAGDLESIRISGIFWIDDPTGFSRLIESSAGLRTQWVSADRIELRN